MLTDKALEVHAATFVFDGHNDLPWEMRTKADSSFAKRDIRQPQPKMHTDIPRLKAGGVGAQFWSVYVPAETAKKGTALQDTLEQIALVQEMIATISGRVRAGADGRRHREDSQGRARLPR